MTSAAAAEAPGSDRLIRVLIVDDSATVRAVLARRLDADPALEVVGRAGDGLEALELILRDYADSLDSGDCGTPSNWRDDYEGYRDARKIVQAAKGGD